MPIIQIGSLAIMTKWVILGIAVIGGLLVERAWLAKTQATETKKYLFNLLSNGVFIGFLSWKGSLLVLEPKVVLESPLSLLYFTGGSKGLYIALGVTVLYFLYHSKKNQPTLIRSILIMSFATLMINELLTLFLLSSVGLPNFIKTMSFFFLLLLTLYFNGKHKKEVYQMLKKAALIVGLSGLLLWTMSSTILAKFNDTSTVEPDSETVEFEVGLAEGQLAPDFSLKTLNGEEIKLSSLRGKRVLLNFWASWCPPCKAEMPHMQDFYEENTDTNVELLSVNLTTAEKKSTDVVNFVEDYKLSFPILLDEHGEIGNMYQAITIPTSYLIDSNGVIRKKIVGPMDKELMYELINSVQ